MAMMQQEQREAAMAAFGDRLVVRRGVSMLEPAYGAKFLASYMNAVLPAEEDATYRLFRDMGLSKTQVDLFYKTKKFVRGGRNNGGRLMVQPLVPGISKRDLRDVPDVPTNVTTVPDVRIRKYTLLQIFTDADIQDKLQLSPQLVELARRLAVTEPSEAAARIKSALDAKGFINTRVLAGDYALSAKRCSDVIFQYAQDIVYSDSAVQAVATPDNLKLTYDQFVGKPIWEVFGPLRYAREIMAIYQLCIRHSPERIIAILGIETIKLGIDVRNLRTNMCYDGQIDGYASVLGVEPMSDAQYPTGVTSEQLVKLTQVSSKVLPVRIDGKCVGSAVRVTDKVAIVNTHVLELEKDNAGEITIAGARPLEAREMAADLCVVRHVGNAATWGLRSARLHERVVVCYHVGDRVEFSEVLRVTVTTEAQLALGDSTILRPGCSGAAVIALEDFTLLGIFSGRSGHEIICSPFLPATFRQVMDADSVASSEVRDDSPHSFGDATYERMVRRGLLSALKDLHAATTPVYRRDGAGTRHLAGTIACFSNMWRTTVDVQCGELFTASGDVVRFNAQDDCSTICTRPSSSVSLKSVATTRAAAVGERVCVFSRNGDGVVMSKSCVVMSTGLHDRTFVIEGIPTDECLVGGLIISVRDAAVLGQFVNTANDVYGDPVCNCAGLPDNSAVVDISTLVTWFHNRFNYTLGMSDRTIPDIFHHTETVPFSDFDYYDRMGENVLKSNMWHALHSNNIDGAAWDGINERVLSADALERVGVSFGFHDHSAYGFDGGTDYKFVAKLVRAVCGYLYMTDTAGFDKVVRHMQLDGISNQMATPVSATFPSLLSRSTTPLARDISDHTLGRKSDELDSLRRDLEDVRRQLKTMGR